MSESGEPLDLAVVGAGTAGLYCAWRAATGAVGAGSALPRSDGTPRIGLFEAASRVGGRIHTVVPEGARTLRGELGGIALMSGHELLMGLVEHLGLAREPLRGGDPHDLLYLRDHRFTAREWADGEAVPYDVGPQERGRTPEQLLAGAIEVVVPDARNLDPRGWDERKRELSFGGRPLTDWGLWNLMRELVSTEAFRLMADAGSFRPQFENWNAAEAIADLCADWPPGSRYERLRDGYEALPAALAEGLRAAGGSVHVGHRLRAVDRSGDPDGTMALTFETSGGASTTTLAERVVLALPQAGLARLSKHTPLAGEAGFAGDLESVYAIPLFHLLLGYERPWWEDLGIVTGRSATDLPIQTCFYFGSEDPAADGKRRSLAMVGYSSPEAIAFWDAYLAPTGAGTGEPVPRKPPAEMLAEVTRQLSALHGVEVPEPYWALLMDWRGDPYGGASHRWAVGARCWEVIPRMRDPLPGLGLHVCGEAWSDCQGWVEGGLRSSERVLQDALGLEPPDWLAADAYLGP